MAKKNKLKDFLTIGAKAFIGRVLSTLAIWLLILLPASFFVTPTGDLTMVNPIILLISLILALMITFIVEGFVLNKLYGWD